MELAYIQDPGHGWIKVPVALLLELSIAGDITSFSYYRDGFAYLEEDCDAARFMNAYRARFGQDPKLRERVARELQGHVRNATRALGRSAPAEGVVVRADRRLDERKQATQSAILREERHRLERLEDRKSTRLNSSHT